MNTSRKNVTKGHLSFKFNDEQHHLFRWHKLIQPFPSTSSHLHFNKAEYIPSQLASPAAGRAVKQSQASNQQESNTASF